MSLLIDRLTVCLSESYKLKYQRVEGGGEDGGEVSKVLSAKEFLSKNLHLTVVVENADEIDVVDLQTRCLEGTYNY